MSPTDAQRKRDRHVAFYIGVVTVLAAFTTGALVYVEMADRTSSVNWIAFGLFATLLFVGETKTALWMRFGNGGEVTPGYAFAYALALLGSPAGAVAVMAHRHGLRRHQEPQAAPQDHLQRRRHLARALGRRTGTARVRHRRRDHRSRLDPIGVGHRHPRRRHDGVRHERRARGRRARAAHRQRLPRHDARGLRAEHDGRRRARWHSHRCSSSPSSSASSCSRCSASRRSSCSSRLATRSSVPTRPTTTR